MTKLWVSAQTITTKIFFNYTSYKIENKMDYNVLINK